MRDCFEHEDLPLDVVVAGAEVVDCEPPVVVEVEPMKQNLVSHKILDVPDIRRRENKLLVQQNIFNPAVLERYANRGWDQSL